jgi:hypothetical protein
MEACKGWSVPDFVVALGKMEKGSVRKRERVGFSAVVRRPAERCQERVSDADDQKTTM